MHEQMERLYEAAKILRGVEGQSAVARLLNVSPQAVKNWESRGISSGGMITAQEKVGCSSTWLKTGSGDMASKASACPIENPGDNNVSTLTPKNPLIDELMYVAKTISDRGLAELIGRAKEVSLQHPRITSRAEKRK